MIEIGNPCGCYPHHGLGLAATNSRTDPGCLPASKLSRLSGGHDTGRPIQLPPPMTIGLAISKACAYLRRMFKAFEFCIPTRGIKVPSSPDWFLQVKQV